MTRKYFDQLMERWQERGCYLYKAMDATSLITDDLFIAFAHIDECAEARELLDDLCFMASQAMEYSDKYNKLESKLSKIESILNEK